MRILGIPLGLFIVIAIITSTSVDCSAGTDPRSKETPEDSDNDSSPSDTIILRKKRTIRYEDLPLSIRKRLAENLETISDYEDDLDDEEPDNSQNIGRQNREAPDYENDSDDHNMEKRETMTDEENRNQQVEEINEANSLPSDSRVKRDRSIQESLRKKANLEIAKSQLERVEKKVKDEIKSLKKRSKSSKNHSQIEKDSKKRQIAPLISPLSHPRLLKIEVDTFEIGREGLKEVPENLERLKKAEVDTNVLNNYIEPQKEIRRDVSPSENTLEPENKEKIHQREIADQLQKKIDALKEKIKRDVEENYKIQEIEANNAKYDELMKFEAESVEDESRDLGREKRLEEDLSEDSDSINGVDQEDADVAEDANRLHESIRKRSAPEFDDNEIEEEIKLTRKGNPRTRKFKKSVLPSQKYKNDDEMDSNMEIHKSEVKLKRSKGLTEGKRRLKHSKFSGSDDKRRSFLFPGQLYTRQRREMNSQRRKLGSYKRKRGGRAKHKHRRQSGNKGRWERAADEPLDNVQADSVAEADSMVDIANAQDLGSQLASEYQEAFGGLPNEPSAPLTRNKRIKRSS